MKRNFTSKEFSFFQKCADSLNLIPIRRICLSCLLTLMISFSAFSQTRVITGKVSDEKGESLPGVSIKEKDSENATQTDLDGNYRITVSTEKPTLVFTYVGFTTKEVLLSGNVSNVTLTSEATSLNEIVVTAFASQKKVNVTGAVSTVDAKDIVASPVANVTNALIGNAPGISGLQSSGEPGRNSTKIYIRGVSTYGGNTDPLIVIDGVEQTAERPYDQLNSMDANEIESVSILKDASSTAVYGIRGANGVIIVTTKRGKLGKPSINVTSNFGYTEATALTNSATSYQWAVMRNQAINILNNSLNDPGFNNLLFTDDELWKFKNNRDYTPDEVASFSFLSDEQKTQLNNSPALYFGSHDYYKETFNNKGPQQQFNISVRGGSEKVKYYTSLGAFNQGSILQDASIQNTNSGSTFNRYNFRSNFDIKPIKSLTISVNLAGQFGGTKSPSFNFGSGDNFNRYKNLIQYLQEGNPAMVPGVIDGRVVTNVAGVNGGTSVSNPLGIKGSVQNTALSQLLLSGSGNVNNTLLSSAIKINHQMDYLTKGLSVRGTVAYDDSYTNYIAINSSVPSYTVRRDPLNPNNLDFFGGAIGQQSYSSSDNNWNRFYFDFGFDYQKSFKGNNFTGLLLAKGSLYNMPSDVFNIPSGIEGLVGRLTYNYKERYQAELNLGYNGTENFAPGNRFGFFPAYSAGWVPSNESFFPKNDIITFLKFRASYGEVGNDQISGRRYLFLPSSFGLLNQARYYLGTSDGSAVNPSYTGTLEGALGNPLVTWERSAKTDIGLEARFLKDRLSLTLDLFKEDRDNILTTLGIIPLTFGVSGGNIPPVNVGITTNKGYEFSLGYADQKGDFNYGINGSVSYTRNKVVYRAEAPNPYPWQNQTGQAIGQYFGFVSDGFFNTPEELADRPYDTYNSNRNVLGDIRYKDLNGDGLINNLDQGPIGYSNLPQYAFNTRLNFGYKGFDLSVLFNGTANGSFYLPVNQTGVYFKNYGNVYQWQYDGVWTPEKVASGEKITYPRPELNTTMNNSNFLLSDFWLKSSDFIKLKNIEVGYTWRKVNFLKKLDVKSIRIFATGNNLFILNDKLSQYGVDPETTDSRNGQYGYVFPITRAYNFGLNVQF